MHTTLSHERFPDQNVAGASKKIITSEQLATISLFDMNQRLNKMCIPRRIQSEENFFHPRHLVKNERIEVEQRLHSMVRPNSVDCLRSQRQNSKNTTPDPANVLQESRRVLAEARLQRRQRNSSFPNKSQRRATKSGGCSPDEVGRCYGNSNFDHFTLIRRNERGSERASKQTDHDVSEKIADIMQELKLCNSKLIEGLSRMDITDSTDKSVSASVTQFLQKCDGVLASIDEEKMRRQVHGTKARSNMNSMKKSCSSLHGLMTTKRQSSFHSYRSDDVLLRRRRSSVRFDLSKNQEFLIES